MFKMKGLLPVFYVRRIIAPSSIINVAYFELSLLTKFFNAISQASHSSTILPVPQNCQNINELEKYQSPSIANRHRRYRRCTAGWIVDHANVIRNDGCWQGNRNDANDDPSSRVVVRQRFERRHTCGIRVQGLCQDFWTRFLPVYRCYVQCVSERYWSVPVLDDYGGERWLCEYCSGEMNRSRHDIFFMWFCILTQVLPVAYALMSRKTDCAYAAVIPNIMHELLPDLQPGTIISDFEAALQNNMARLFPHSTIQGCFFHLCHVSLYFAYYLNGGESAENLTFTLHKNLFTN